MQKIEVDDEVFEYLKNRAEPFVDTPNTVLRRELLGPGPKTGSNGRSASGILPAVPPGTPKALQHILEVTYLVVNSSRTRQEATHFVAKRDGVAFQTVLDKYCRQLDLTADDFDRLLAGPRTRELRLILEEKFPRHRSLINESLS